MATAAGVERDYLQTLVAISNVAPKPGIVVARKKKRKRVRTKGCHILALNTDCLLKIFDYLTMMNLLAVEMVCSRWKDVVKLSWRRFTEFDGTRSYHRYLDRSYRRCLIRCGPYMKKISFPPLVHGSTSVEFLNIVANQCPHLEHAVLNDVQFQKPYMRNLSKILKRLMFLEIPDNTFQITYKILKTLFERVPHLRGLTFTGFTVKSATIISKAFQHLPKTVTKVNFGGLNYVEDNFFIMLRKYCPDLEELTLTAETHYLSFGRNSKDVGSEIAKFPKLKHLEVKNIDMQIESMRPILSLTFLEKLSLAGAHEMDDDFVGNIAESLPLLKYLDIQAPTDEPLVTDKGLKKLAKLTNLEHLDLSYYNMISYEGVAAVAAANINLKELVLIYTSVTDKVIPAVINHCHELQFLDLSACLYITSESVDSLCEIFTLGNKRKQLTVILGGTEYMNEIDCEFLEKVTAPNLVLDSDTNNINSRLRRRYEGAGSDDFDDDDEDYDDFDDYEDHDSDWFDYDDEYINYEYQLEHGLIDIESAVWSLNIQAMEVHGEDSDFCD